MHDPVAYTFEADTHCPACTEERFGRGPGGWIAEDATDGEGNPVGVIAPWDDEPDGLYCGTCHGTILEPWSDPEPDPEDDEPVRRRTVASDVFETLPDGSYRHQSVLFPRSHASWCVAGEPCHPDRRDDWWAAR